MNEISNEYEIFSDDTVEEFEQLGAAYKKNEKNSKAKTKQYIIKRNLKKMKETAQGELQEEEYIEAECEGSLTALNYLGNMTSADYAFMMLAAYNDFPVKYHVYLTTKKVIIYEIGSLKHIGRQYVFEYTDISHFKFKKYKDYIKLFFKVEKDKYNQFRTAGNWLLYPFVNRRIGINIFNDDRELILKFIQRKLGSI
ncbi:MAG: hypothetical protein K0S71_1348 [Clostridia bacterium]|jgi:hypothetical protein|nr:hypothetical protein [Clostridia bacterium]